MKLKKFLFFDQNYDITESLLIRSKYVKTFSCFLEKNYQLLTCRMQIISRDGKKTYSFKPILFILLIGFSAYMLFNIQKMGDIFKGILVFDFDINKSGNYSLKGTYFACKTVDTSLATDEYQFTKLPTENLYIYSAFLDLRSQKRFIKIIGMSGFVVNNLHKVYCQIYYEDGAMISVSGVTQKAKVNSPFVYIQSIYVCEEPLGINPVAVSLSGKLCLDTPSTRRKVNIRYNKRDDEVPNKYLLCLNTIFNFRHPKKLIAFIEYQKMLGLARIIVYDFYLPSEEVMKVVKYYVQDGILSVQPWKLPVQSDDITYETKERKLLKYYGQLMQVNDCMYRNMNDYKYVLSADLDEYVVFHNSSIKTYPQLMKIIESKFNGSAGYRFKRVLLCLSKREMETDADHLFLFKTSRSKHKHGMSKSIYNPRKVLRMHVHIPTEYLGILQHVKIPANLALIYHYRQHKLQYCHKYTNATLKIASKLQSKVDSVFNQIFQTS